MGPGNVSPSPKLGFSCLSKVRMEPEQAASGEAKGTFSFPEMVWPFSYFAWHFLSEFIKCPLFWKILSSDISVLSFHPPPGHLKF